MKILSRKYRKLAEPSQFEEVSRRFALLTQPFVAECLEKVSETLRKLRITISEAVLVRKTLALMQQVIILLPEIGPSRCILVRELTAEFIALGITHIKKERLKHIRDDWNKNTRSDSAGSAAEEEKPADRKKKQVSVNVVGEVIQEPDKYSIFVREYKGFDVRKSDEIVRTPKS